MAEITDDSEPEYLGKIYTHNYSTTLFKEINFKYHIVIPSTILFINGNIDLIH